MNPRERGIAPPDEKRPPIVETIGGSGMVGILGDGTWVVGWGNYKADGTRSGTSWHHHEDAFGVLRQHKRVIHRFLGVPSIKPEEDKQVTDPNPGLSIAYVAPEEVVPGENELIEVLAQRIQNAAALAASNRMSQERAFAILSDLKIRLRAVKNPYKVRAREQVESVLNAGEEITVGQFNDVSLPLLERVAEGTRIVEALIKRGGEVLDWTRLQEDNLSPITFTLSTEIKHARRGEIRANEWQQDFSSDTDVFELSRGILGHPYQNVGQKEIEKLKAQRDRALSDPLNALTLLREVYGPFYDIREKRLNRNASGEFNIFKPAKSVSQDTEIAKQELSNPSFANPAN